ncbi:S26 family signal peptidase [Streptomyces sp. enrichment culture]|uniref:S26 family signal peptidase n=1 Tax=Streptomyces sp. enrichment culture TaxID=1795815 RepID=UPI003F56658F
MFAAPDRRPGGGVVVHRVIGVGGDRPRAARSGGTARRVTVSGRRPAEPYVKDGCADGPRTARRGVRVPGGRLFLLGDHRLPSRDPRRFADGHGGTVPVGTVRGGAAEDRAGVVLLAVGTLLGPVLVVVGCAACSRGGPRGGGRSAPGSGPGSCGPPDHRHGEGPAG